MNFGQNLADDKKRIEPACLAQQPAWLGWYKAK